jgi:Predicted metal binding domain
MSTQIVDESVSRMKFDREVDSWRSNSVAHTRRGIFVLETVFPKVFAVFCASHLTPQIVLFAVELDFTNYDV